MDFTQWSCRAGENDSVFVFLGPTVGHRQLFGNNSGGEKWKYDICRIDAQPEFEITFTRSDDSMVCRSYTLHVN